MKLKNRNPRDLIGRTIFVKGQAWLIKGVDDEHVLLEKPGLQVPGKLRLRLFDECRLFPEAEEIRAQFPRLIRALRQACMLTTGEAENAVLGMIVNGPFFLGSEALAHIGGAGNAISHCWRLRHIVRRSYAGAVARAINK